MQSQWTFVSNHALVLASLQGDPFVRQREIADAIGITRGAVQRILHDLAASQHISVERVGRRNKYRINTAAPLRHPAVESAPVSDLLAALRGKAAGVAASDEMAETVQEGQAA